MMKFWYFNKMYYTIDNLMWSFFRSEYVKYKKIVSYAKININFCINWNNTLTLR